MEDTKERRPSQHSRTNTHMHSQRLWQHTQGPHGSVPDGVQTQGRWTQATILNPELSPIDNHWQRKEESSSMESYWVCKPHLRAGPWPSSRRLTQKELNGVLGGFLSHNALSGHYFSFYFFLIELLHICYGFQCFRCVNLWVSEITCVSYAHSLDLFSCLLYSILFCLFLLYLIIFLKTCLHSNEREKGKV